MSYIITLTGDSSVLSAQFDLPIILNDETSYAIGLLQFESYNTIPNIFPPNNTFKLYGNDDIVIATGAYELSNLNDAINLELGKRGGDFIELKGNNNTMKTLIRSTKWIDFTPKTSIASLLGFDAKQYEPNKWHESETLTKIITINSLLIHCNVAMGSYKNGVPSHIIHQFYPTVPAGFKIVEAPSSIIYLPINRKTITNIQVKITDQDDKPVSFASETVTVSLHLKKL